MTTDSINKLRDIISELRSKQQLLVENIREITLFGGDFNEIFTDSVSVDLLDRYINSADRDEEILRLLVIYFEDILLRMNSEENIDDLAFLYTEATGCIDVVLKEYLQEQGVEGAIYALKEACGLLL